ncbi:MAG TPA: peptidylprolyl isomerase [candidate division Zixibacteria bacterium]|nr:peptidylprolyl isomerase [candidate division Zixibacteria bacterium]
MLFYKRLGLLAFIAVIALSGCGKPPTPIYLADKAGYTDFVARVDDRFGITMADLYDSLYNSDRMAGGGVMEPEAIKAVLDSILVDTLVGFLADETDISKSYPDYRGYQNLYSTALLQAFFDEKIKNEIKIDSAEVVEFYYSRPDLFSVEEQVLLYHILISHRGFLLGPDSIAFKAMDWDSLQAYTKAYAFEVKARLDSGMVFEKVAQQYSHDSHSNKRGGYVGWTKRGTYNDPFDSIAFNLMPGQISEPYPDDNGWHIIWVPQHFNTGLQPLDTSFYQIAKETLTNMKTNERGRTLIDSIKTLPRDIVYNEPLLDTNIYKVERSEWVAVVNGTDTIDCNEVRSLEEAYRGNNRIDNSTSEMKREMIDHLADRKMMLEVAHDLGIDTLDYVCKQEYDIRHSFARRYAAQDQAEPSWLPSKEEIEAYYNKHLADFRVDKPLKVQHIIVPDSMMGELVRDQALAGVDFMELARQYYPGESSIRVDLADLGWINKNDVPAEVWRAAIQTLVGNISHPVKTEFGYHIVKVLDRHETKGVDEASPEISKILRRKHSQEVYGRFRDMLYARYDVSFPNKISPVHLRPVDQRQEGHGESSGQ